MSFNIINLFISYYLFKTRFKTLMSLKVQKKQAKITITFTVKPVYGDLPKEQ